MKRKLEEIDSRKAKIPKLMLQDAQNSQEKKNDSSSSKSSSDGLIGNRQAVDRTEDSSIINRALPMASATPLEAQSRCDLQEMCDQFSQLSI